MRDSIIDQQLDLLLSRRLPIIAWDWDGTLSANGVTVIHAAWAVMKSLSGDYGFKHIIVTGRVVSPSIVGWPFGSADAVGAIICNLYEGNPYKFKFYVLRRLWKGGFGVLRMYIDNDQDLLETLRKNESELPVSHVHQWSLEMLIQQLMLFRKLKARSDHEPKKLKNPLEIRM